MLFGIAGHRYVSGHEGSASHADDKSGLPNKYWKYPFAHEIPKGSDAVEHSAYWRQRR
jgi:hypothetical protein